MAESYNIAGKPTTIGDPVHYVDGDGVKHAAILKKVTPPETNGTGAHTAHIHTFHRDDGSDTHMKDIQHSVAGYPNTWTHRDS